MEVAPLNVRLVMYLILPYLEWMERGDDPKLMDANMTEDLPHVIRLARSFIENEGKS